MLHPRSSRFSNCHHHQHDDELNDDGSLVKDQYQDDDRNDVLLPFQPVCQHVSLCKLLVRSLYELWCAQLVCNQCGFIHAQLVQVQYDKYNTPFNVLTHGEYVHHVQLEQNNGVLLVKAHE